MRKEKGPLCVQVETLDRMVFGRDKSPLLLTLVTPFPHSIPPPILSPPKSLSYMLLAVGIFFLFCCDVCVCLRVCVCVCDSCLALAPCPLPLALLAPCPCLVEASKA
jgi:hypothetical protein